MLRKKLLLIILLIVGCDNNPQESTTNWKCMPEGIDTLTVSDDWYISTTYSYYIDSLDKNYLLVDTTLFNGSWKTEEDCDIAGCEDDYTFDFSTFIDFVNYVSPIVDENDMEMMLDSLNMKLPIAWYCEPYLPRSMRPDYCFPKKGTCIENND